MAKYNGLIIPRTYNDYFSRSTPEAMREFIGTTLDENLDKSSNNAVQNRAISAIIPEAATAENMLVDREALETETGTIKNLIPEAANEENQLADKAFVNSTVGTNTAIFRGTFDSIEELEAYAGEKTNNDYAFVIATDEAGNTIYNRYKYDGESWVFEYTLNNSSFTAEQWAAIQSGITAEKVEILNNLTGLSGVPTGTVIQYAGESIPNGFLLCDGRAISRVDYDKLFSVIGTIWGDGDGETTFNIPDYRETVPVGAGENSTSNIVAHDIYALGEFKDEENGFNAKVIVKDGAAGVGSSGNGNLLNSENVKYNGSWGNTIASPLMAVSGTYGSSVNRFLEIGSNEKNTHGKQIGVNYIIKATDFNEIKEEILDDTRETTGNVMSAAKTGTLSRLYAECGTAADVQAKTVAVDNITAADIRPGTEINIMFENGSSYSYNADDEAATWGQCSHLHGETGDASAAGAVNTIARDKAPTLSVNGSPAYPVTVGGMYAGEGFIDAWQTHTFVLTRNADGQTWEDISADNVYINKNRNYTKKRDGLIEQYLWTTGPKRYDFIIPFSNYRTYQGWATYYGNWDTVDSEWGWATGASIQNRSIDGKSCSIRLYRASSNQGSDYNGWCCLKGY